MSIVLHKCTRKKDAVRLSNDPSTLRFVLPEQELSIVRVVTSLWKGALPIPVWFVVVHAEGTEASVSITTPKED